MFIRRLLVTSDFGTLRDIEFHEGLNLIVDETPASDAKQTGNNVGKTTVLKLINYCLGGKPSELYQDPENKQSEYRTVKDFLEDRHVIVQLELVDSLDSHPMKRVVVRRNFLARKHAIREINGTQVSAKDFEKSLGEELFPQLPEDGMPTFRQLISHNIRYSEYALTHTLETLNSYTKGVEYEALYLFMLGCPREDAQEKQNLAEKRKAEAAFIKRLKNGFSANDYRTAIAGLDRQIEQVNHQRKQFETDTQLARELDESASLKIQLSQIGNELTQKEVRIAIIEEANQSLAESKSSIDMNQLRSLYAEASAFIPDLHRTFDELVAYHNSMITEKMRFITSELPALIEEQASLKREFDELTARDAELNRILAEKTAGADFESLIAESNELHRQKGEYENQLKQLEDAEAALNKLDEKLAELDANATASGLKERLDQQVKKFNSHFSKLSQQLYGESYALSYDEKTTQEGVKYLHFHLLNVHNLSSGKKQGEMLCFDMAYTTFADAEGIDCMHFLLNDKKELMHGNQLARLSQVAVGSNVQLIASMLEDKLPPEINSSRNIVLRLSQSSKFFRIEEFEGR